MEQKTAVVTGANSGLGYWTTLALAEKGLSVFMLCRSIERGEKAMDEISEKSLNPNLKLVQVELSSLDSIKQAVNKIYSLTDKVDVLVNNAALVSSKRMINERGIELTFAVNHIAPFYLTHLLLPLLIKSSDARIINISSTNHRRVTIQFDDIHLLGNYHILKAYSQSKLANVLFSYELERKIKTRRFKNVSVYCVDPGHNNTPIGLKVSNRFHKIVWYIRSKMGKPAKKGAECQIYLSLSSEVRSWSGLYWKDLNPIESSYKSHDASDAKRLWELSLKSCGITDYFNLNK